jgi:hypothetical protein
MIRKQIGQLVKRAKKIFAALKETCVAVIDRITAVSDVVPDEKKILVASADGNVLDMGKRYRLTSGHAPLFSLFTFFKDSQ